MGLRKLGALLLLPVALWAQDEVTLRRFFEGKQVIVKLDMPASHEGVDYRFREEPALDFRSYSSRIRKYGISIRNGDKVMITGIKLKKKNIEFQLAGGGYGSFGDDNGEVATPNISKSKREKQLERDIEREPDSGQRQRLRRDLDRLRDQRERDERRQREAAAELETVKKAEVAQKRLQSGSRFNLWFPDKYLNENVPSAEDIMDMLQEWVDFGTLR